MFDVGVYNCEGNLFMFFREKFAAHKVAHETSDFTLVLVLFGIKEMWVDLGEERGPSTTYVE